MRYIIITGVNFNNKGAQAMMFHLYYYLQKKWSDKKVVALCKNTEEQLKRYRERYKIRAVSFYLADSFYVEGGLYRIAGCIKGIQSRRNSLRLQRILRNTDLCVDASGFNFSSKFGPLDNYAWLENIEIMKRHKIPVVIMPQSFGPFDFPNWYRWGLKVKAQAILQYPKKIFAREQAGFDDLKEQFHVKNLFLSPDLVLLGNDLRPKDFYRNLASMKIYKVADGSVAVVPNQKLQTHSTDLNGESIYVSTIKALRKENKKVYIIRHCDSDKKFCESLFKKFQDSENVFYIDEDLDCIEYAELIKHFDFAVVSRYHGIVHSYKAGTPCVVIGWADKYQELTQQLCQSRYVMDLKSYDESVLQSKIHEMCLNCQNEKVVINRYYGELIKSFDLYKIAFDGME
ncbi:MAG: polysaccharide pyruvyl transferase family protein [Lachnospiraceae bacterium]|nr:polysaccharide pyruvyl transferase family protein [Lachnospiraceae bacterium]